MFARSTCVDGEMRCGTAPCPGDNHTIFCVSSTWARKAFLICFICSYPLQWIVGGVSGRRGAHAVAHVTWASDAAIGQEPIQPPALVAVPARASASDWTHAALRLVSVQ